jgi:hypothetical protein
MRQKMMRSEMMRPDLALPCKLTPRKPVYSSAWDIWHPQNWLL